MRRCLSVLEVADKILMSIVIAFLVITLSQSVLAKDAGITIQTTLSSSYAYTKPLSKLILNQLQVSVNTDDKSKIRKVLSQLRDGDILVLSVHSNPSVFGIGVDRRTGAIQWAHFWKHFGIEKPPKLAAVITTGCMARQYEQNGTKYYVPLTASEAEFIRKSLNTWTLFCAKREVQPSGAVSGAHSCLESILSGKKFSEIYLGDNWQYISHPELDRDKISLAELRAIGTQFFLESDIDLVVPAIRPQKVSHRGVMGPSTVQNILNEGVWGAIEYTGRWDFRGEVIITSGAIAFLTPDKARACFEEDAKELRESFKAHKRRREDKHEIKGPGTGVKKEDSNRLTYWLPWVEEADDMGSRSIYLRHENAVIWIDARYFSPIEDTQLVKIMEDMEAGLVLVVDSALERLGVEFKEK